LETRYHHEVTESVESDGTMECGVTEKFLMSEKDYEATSAVNTGITPDSDNCYANIKPCNATVVA